MPKRVSEVPNPWKRYMDGSIWEFTTEEMDGMPEFVPMVSEVSHGVLGMTKIQWYVQGKYYVRFYHPEDVEDKWWLERAAGWI